MASTVPFSVSYTQQDDGSNGSITLNGETITANGRLDNIGDFVFAEGFASTIFVPTGPGSDKAKATVECVRTSKKTMQIRIMFIALVDSTGYDNYYDGGLEKVIDNVKIDFD